MMQGSLVTRQVPELVIERENVEEISNHAAESWPEECCGLLLGKMERGRCVVEQVRPARNVHAGDRRRGYEIDANAVLESLRASRCQGWGLLGFYHSHPDGSTEPSSWDARDAWLGKIYVIVGWPVGGIGFWYWDADSPCPRKQAAVIIEST